MPRVGLGTWRLEGDPLLAMLDQAFDLGYRLVDTASYYGNETSVGRGIRMSGLPRESLFVTTKVRGAHHGAATSAAVEASLDRLGLENVDLVLIHWPLPMRDLYQASWEELIALQRRGLVKSIGVSNFNPKHVERLIASTGVTPAVNQIQCSPAIHNRPMRDANASRGILTQAWEPLGQRSDVMNREEIREIARTLGRTPAQVVLRWHLQQGNAVVVKTATRSRLGENLDVFDWAIPPELFEAMDELPQDDENRVDPEVTVVL